VQDQLDLELRQEKLRKIWAAAAGGVLFLCGGFLLWASSLPRESRLVEGTAVSTRQVQDDEEHDVRLVVELEGGGIVTLKADEELVPLGSRVVVVEHKSWLGRTSHLFGGLSPAADAP
jgi:hypothetical protein